MADRRLARPRLRFEWAGEGVEVAVRPSRRARHVHLKVRPPLRIEVVVPYGFDRLFLPEILERHREWLARHLERLRGQQETVVAPPAEVNLQALGQRWRVSYRQAGLDERSGWREHSGFHLEIRHDEGEEWRALLLSWVRATAERELPSWLRQVSGDLGLEFARVSIRGQRSRWGSCSARGTVSLNFRLLFLPPALVRYLFVHELCHTVHLNHSPRYWRLVAEKEPQFQALDGELRGAGRHVPAWAQPD